MATTRSDVTTRLRLAFGLVLLASSLPISRSTPSASTRLLAVEQGREPFVGVWRSPPGSSLPAVGDTVNVAARLESLTKELAVQLAVSARLAGRGGIDLAQFELRRIAIRGRQRPLRVRLVPDAMALPLGGAGVRRSHDPARTRWPMRLDRRRSLDAPSP